MSSWIIQKEKENTMSLPVQILSAKQLELMRSPLAIIVLQELAKNPQHPRKLAKTLKVSEQKVYYTIKKLLKAEIVKIVKEEYKDGAVAKIYGTTSSAIAIPFTEFQQSAKLMTIKENYKKVIEPFVSEGNFDALVIMGSPEPHGPAGVRSKDGPSATQLGLVFGSFLNYMPPSAVLLDTQVKEEDLKNNLIIIGGPRSNAIAELVNKKLPVRFESQKRGDHFYSTIVSDFSKKSYKEEEGIIVKAPNPFDNTKQILLLAGKGKSGTQAALLALTKELDTVCEGNVYNKKAIAKVIDGVDENSDGVIDAIHFLE